jgi:hypothetical protein
MIKTSSGTVYYTQQEVNQKINEVMEDGYRITNAIHEEACERDWCDQYDEWAENINTTLKFFEIPLMTKEYDVVYTITRTQEARVTVKVTSRSEDDAEDEASEMYSTYELADKVKEYDWDTQDVTIDSTEVEEA